MEERENIIGALKLFSGQKVIPPRKERFPLIKPPFKVNSIAPLSPSVGEFNMEMDLRNVELVPPIQFTNSSVTEGEAQIMESTEPSAEEGSGFNLDQELQLTPFTNSNERNIDQTLIRNNGRYPSYTWDDVRSICGSTSSMIYCNSEKQNDYAEIIALVTSIISIVMATTVFVQAIYHQIRSKIHQLRKQRKKSRSPSESDIEKPPQKKKKWFHKKDKRIELQTMNTCASMTQTPYLNVPSSMSREFDELVERNILVPIPRYPNIHGILKKGPSRFSIQSDDSLSESD
jgi:hypothetical protein